MKSLVNNNADYTPQNNLCPTQYLSDVLAHLAACEARLAQHSDQICDLQVNGLTVNQLLCSSATQKSFLVAKI